MSSSALDGASKYLNNLLLARGFLQDGNFISFVLLAREDQTTNGDFDSSTTTATIINLIHDLILRRDRDAEQKEALASTIQTLRAEESQRLLDLQRLQDKNIRLKNDLSTLEAQQRSIVAATKKAQSESKELKEQALKVKSTLDQVRAKSISDIRKRDVEIHKLQNHLSGLNRGKKESMVGSNKANTTNVSKSTDKENRSRQEGTSTDWCLENENTDFLTAVLNETSAENVALRKIVGDSLDYLKTLTGLDELPQQKENSHDLADMNKAIGIPGQFRNRHLHDSTDSTQSDALTPVQSLASSMSEVLTHCRAILRDPSFVPIEEVQVRDDEIAKLRAGWEKMADRWKEAVTMMAQWRQKVMSDDQEGPLTNDDHPRYHSEIEILPPMPVFSRSIATRPNGQPVLDPIQEEELTSILLDHHSRLGNQSMVSNDHDASLAQEDTLPEPDETGTPRQPGIRIHVDEESDLDLSDQPALPTMASPARRGVRIQRPTDKQAGTIPLSNSNANAKKRKSPDTSSGSRKRRSTSPISQVSPAIEQIRSQRSCPVDSSITTEGTDPLHLETLTSEISGNEVEEDLFAVLDEASRNSKIPRMSVAEKLAAVEAEATEATEVIRRRQATSYGPTDKRGKDRERSIKSSKSIKKIDRKISDSKTRLGTTKGTSQHRDKEVRSVKEKDGVKKARDRRRSTLTPAELGSLMGR